RAADYRAFIGELRKLLSKKRSDPELGAGVSRLAKKLDELKSIDFFGASGRKEAEEMLKRVRARLREGGKSAPPQRGSARPDLTDRVWVTRRGVKIDRIASAWLVRRFIDPAAQFPFVDPADTAKKPGELRFDMSGGDFTHEGDRCTFETLLARAGLREKALFPIAEIVHDIDLKDDKYGRPEVRGVRQILEGLLAAHPSD